MFNGPIKVVGCFIFPEYKHHTTSLLYRLYRITLAVGGFAVGCVLSGFLVEDCFAVWLVTAPGMIGILRSCLAYIKNLGFSYPNTTSSDFNRNLVHTLNAINKKHGDITQGCLLESDCMKTMVLLGICKVVEDLQKKQLKDLDGNSLDSYYTAVRDAENLKVDVQWLHNRLDEIRDACKLSDGAKGLVDEMDRRVGKIYGTKRELSQRRFDLERIESEGRGIEELLAREIVMVEELNKNFGDQISKMSQFQHANLM
ncbi:hypothetical protein OROHE_010097 [Orobanche hederae]